MFGSEMDRTWKSFIKIFQECGLSVVYKINLTSVNSLDVRFDMKQGTYTPYRNPNSHPIHSNHSPTNIQIIHPQNILTVHW